MRKIWVNAECTGSWKSNRIDHVTKFQWAAIHSRHNWNKTSKGRLSMPGNPHTPLWISTSLWPVFKSSHFPTSTSQVSRSKLCCYQPTLVPIEPLRTHHRCWNNHSRPFRETAWDSVLPFLEVCLLRHRRAHPWRGLEKVTGFSICYCKNLKLASGL